MPKPIIKQFEKLLGDYMEAGKDNVRFNCPFKHAKGFDEDYKMYVHKHTGKFHCFSCGRKGQEITRLYDQMGQDAPVERKDFMTQLMGYLYPSDEENETTEQELYEPDFISELTPDHPVYHYLTKVRGLTDKQIEYFGFKACIVELEQKMQPAAFFPVYDNGELVYWQARGISPDLKYQKFRNPKSVHKTKYVFNNEHEHEDTIICEGFLSTASAGYNAECLMGKTMSKAQKDLILSKGRKTYYFCLDRDAFGHSVVYADQFYREGVNVKVVVMPEGMDPNDIGTNIFRTAYLPHAIDYNPTVLPQLLELVVGKQEKNLVKKYFNLY